MTFTTIITGSASDLPTTPSALSKANPLFDTHYALLIEPLATLDPNVRVQLSHDQAVQVQNYYAIANEQHLDAEDIFEEMEWIVGEEAVEAACMILGWA